MASYDGKILDFLKWNDKQLEFLESLKLKTQKFLLQTLADIFLPEICDIRWCS